MPETCRNPPFSPAPTSFEPNSSASRICCPVASTTLIILPNGCTAMICPYVISPFGMLTLIPPPFANAMSAPVMALYASAHRSPRFVSPYLTMRLPSASVATRSTFEVATTLFSRSAYFVLMLSINFAVSLSLSFATSPVTYSAEMAPLPVMTILPMFSSFVPVATIWMLLPFLSLTLFTSVL